MRVTENMRISAVQDGVQRAQERLFVTSQRASSGDRISGPSDDPTAYTAIAGNDASITKLEARSVSISRAQSDLQLADSQLASAGDVMNRAKELALELSNGTMSTSDRAIAAKEVTDLRQQLIGIANAKGENGYLFGGTKNASPPVDPAGNFVGNDEVRSVEVADGVLATVNASGAKAFTAAGGRDVLADLTALSTALATDNQAGITAMIDPMTQDITQVITARASAGISASRLASAADVTSSAALAVKSARSKMSDVDPAAAYTDLATAQAAYQRSLMVTKQILSLSPFTGG